MLSMVYRANGYLVLKSAMQINLNLLHASGLLSNSVEEKNHPLVAMSAATCDERLQHKNITVAPNYK